MSVRSPVRQEDWKLLRLEMCQYISSHASKYARQSGCQRLQQDVYSLVKVSQYKQAVEGI